MPIELGIWRMGDRPQALSFSTIESEKRLEDALTSDLSLLGTELLLLGRQVSTDSNSIVDVLAMDREGNVVVVELKRDLAPRVAVAQLLDYASWAKALSYDDVKQIYAEKNEGEEFEKGFDSVFGAAPPEEVNEEIRLVLVAAELDASSERIIDFLSADYGVPINAVFFRYFRDGGNEYLARTWLIDPREAEATIEKSRRRQEPWNGRDFFVNFGHGETRSWDDARRYGFIAAGGGKAYSQPLENLFPGARIFVNIPGTGYVGVGEVTGTATPVAEFEIEIDGSKVPILEADLENPAIGARSDDPEKTEKLVAVHWIKDVPQSEAYWEKGLFATPHIACRLRNKFTIERLTRHFGLDE